VYLPRLFAVCAVALGGCSDDSGGGGGGSCALPNYPDQTCTGVPSGTTLQRVPADVTSGDGWSWNATDGVMYVTGANAVVDGVDVAGQILVQAPGVTVENCKASGVLVTGAARDPGAARLTVQDCEIDCGGGAAGGTAIGDINVTALRVNVHGCENGFDLDSDATIQDSYIHDLFQAPAAHTDGIQSHLGSRLVIQHNRIYAETPGACGTPEGFTADCGGNSAIIMGDGTDTSSDTTIRDNLFAGGGYTLYCPRNPLTSFEVSNNHWSRLYHPKSGGFGPQDSCLNDDGTPIVTRWTDNVWDDTRDPIAP
jgi:hypothetical protein